MPVHHPRLSMLLFVLLWGLFLLACQLRLRFIFRLFVLLCFLLGFWRGIAIGNVLRVVTTKRALHQRHQTTWRVWCL